MNGSHIKVSGLEAEVGSAQMKKGKWAGGKEKEKKKRKEQRFWSVLAQQNFLRVLRIGFEQFEVFKIFKH